MNLASLGVCYWSSQYFGRMWSYSTLAIWSEAIIGGALIPDSQSDDALMSSAGGHHKSLGPNGL